MLQVESFSPQDLLTYALFSEGGGCNPPRHDGLCDLESMRSGLDKLAWEYLQGSLETLIGLWALSWTWNLSRDECGIFCVLLLLPTKASFQQALHSELVWGHAAGYDWWYSHLGLPQV